MTVTNRYSSLFYFVLVVGCVDFASCQSECPLWHFYSEAKRHCECCSTFYGFTNCEANYVYVMHTHCMTWNDATHDVEVSRCLVTHKDSNLCDNDHMYSIPSNVTGPELM